MNADPVPFFTAVAAEHPRCFWLDGGGAREWSGRRSIIGWLDADDVSLSYSATRREVTRHAEGLAEVVGDDVFTVLAAEIAAGASSDQWFGYLGYACRGDLPARPDPLMPDAVWMRPRHVRLFEHLLPREFIRFPAVATPQKCGFPRFTGETDAPAAYTAAFAQVQEHLHAGDTYEVNLTHRVDVASDEAPAEVYLRLRDLNPAPYAGFLQHDVEGARGWLLSSSPERYATVRAVDDTAGAGRTIETKPIKGTTARGRTPAEDDEARRHLGADPKFRAENLMIVDLLRNDLAQVCEVGSVEVPELMAVESYASVHQLVSTVTGRLRADVGTVEALRALFPAGSMTGAPKLRTMRVIDATEATPRGAYAGAFGWISGDGRADLGVVIRSLLTDGSGTYRLGTGGGITVLSEAEQEWAETQWKADRLLRALRPADLSPR